MKALIPESRSTSGAERVGFRVGSLIQMVLDLQKVETNLHLVSECAARILRLRIWRVDFSGTSNLRSDRS